MMLTGGQVTVIDGAPMDNVNRDLARRTLDADAAVTLYEIVPTHYTEMVRGAWGYGRSPEREEQTFREMAART